MLYTANAAEFATKIVTMDNGHDVRLISIPDFSLTNQVVLLNLKTLECKSLTIDVDEGMSVHDPMDVEEEEGGEGGVDGKSPSP